MRLYRKNGKDRSNRSTTDFHPHHPHQRRDERLIFPVDEGYWSGETLEDLRLVWYNYIDPDKTVEI